MARRFRVYQKKRGSRRTGSQRLGSFGEAAFFAAFLLLGCMGLAVVFSSLVVPQWKANHEFVANTCHVIDARLGEKESGDTVLYRPEIQIEYQVAGETYRSWTYDLRGEYSADKVRSEKILDRFRVDAGREYNCWYDPTDPNTAVLVRSSSSWAWLTLIVPLSFLLIGGGGLAYRLFGWGKSVERKADLTRRAGQIAPLESNGKSKSDYPYVPPVGNITNSPGTTLAFRLPTAPSNTLTLVVTLIVCVLWNGIVAGFAVTAMRTHLAGQPDWLLTLFVLPFAAFGIGLIVFLVRQLLVATGVGPTLVEISDQPLSPGKAYRLFVSQTGRLRLKSLEVLLVCDEEATFRHGTNTRTETRRIYEQQVLRRRALEVSAAKPFETKCEVEVPPGAMHSFKSDHNEINWCLLVRGEVAGWPRYERSFPLLVHPLRNGSTGA